MVLSPNVALNATGWTKMTIHRKKKKIHYEFLPNWKKKNVYPLKPCSTGLCHGSPSVIRCRCGSRPWKAKAQNSHINWVIPEVHRGICGEILYSWECVHTWDKPPLHGFSILSPASNGTVRLNNLAKAGEWRLRHPYALKGNLATLPHFNKCGGFPLPTGQRCQNKSSLTSCPPKKCKTIKVGKVRQHRGSSRWPETSGCCQLCLLSVLRSLTAGKQKPKGSLWILAAHWQS